MRLLNSMAEQTFHVSREQHIAYTVIIIEDMAVMQSMGKPSWVIIRTCMDVASQDHVLSTYVCVSVPSRKRAEGCFCMLLMSQIQVLHDWSGQPNHYCSYALTLHIVRYQKILNRPILQLVVAVIAAQYTWSKSMNPQVLYNYVSDFPGVMYM